jgi:hypothetical protein
MQITRSCHGATMTESPHPIIHRILWNSPTGEISLTVTHTKTFFGRSNTIEIEAPTGTRLPIDTRSFLVTQDELTRAGGAKAFVEQLLRKAERTAAWRKEAAHAVQGDLFSAPPKADPPAKPRSRRRQPTLSAPKR